MAQSNTESPISVQIEDLDIRGFINQPTSVANYLGIPFASVPARFRQAVPIDPRKESGILEATSYGPSCPQPGDEPRGMRQHLLAGTGLSIPEGSPPTYVSEFSCLTLNIYTPAGTPPGARLPVVVWIHGGGWNLGDGNAEFDGRFLVQRSVALGKPIIYVALNYRLGYHGWLASQELRDEARRNGEAGFANQGLHDQRLGLKWIQENIHFFGGDGSQVTLAGQSAGAWCVLAHLRSTFPACQHALIMSSPALRLKSTADAQDTFDRLVAKAGVQASASPATKLAALRELTAQQLQEFLDGPIGKPVFDPEWFVDLDPTRPIEHVDRFPSWLESLAIGQTKEEGAMLLPIWAALKPEDLIGAAKMAIPDPQLADEMVEAYGITLAAGSSVVANFIEFFSDCLYGSVLPAIGERDSPPVYMYRFDQKDVYENSQFYGWAFHSLDNAFFTQFPAVAGPAAPASMQATSKALSQAVVDLVHGSPPWEAYQTAHRVMAFDGENTGLIDVPDRWTRFSSTAQREEAYRMAGERVLEYALQIAAQFALMRQGSSSS